MTQQTETPETPETSEVPEVHGLAAHLRLNLYTDDNIGVDAEANRQQLAMMLGVFFAHLMNTGNMTMKDLYILCHLCLETAVEQSSVDLSDEDDEILCNIQARGRRLTGYSGKEN